MLNELTDQNFATEIENASQPVLIDFWAEWCGPCRQLTPILEEVAKDLEGIVKIYKMNVDNSPETPTKFNVRGIPTMILFKDGKQIDSKVGASDKQTLLNWIKSHLK